MSFEKAKADLEEKGLGDHVIVLNESSATVAEAAHALGVEPASIAKTLSVLQGEKPVLSFNSALILLGALGILPPATSAMLHNLSTLGISLRGGLLFVSDKPAEAQQAAQQEEEQRFTQHRQPQAPAQGRIPPVDVLLGAGAHTGFTRNAFPAAQAGFLQLQAHRALLFTGIAARDAAVALPVQPRKWQHRQQGKHRSHGAEELTEEPGLHRHTQQNEHKQPDAHTKALRRQMQSRQAGKHLPRACAGQHLFLPGHIQCYQPCQQQIFDLLPQKHRPLRQTELLFAVEQLFLNKPGKRPDGIAQAAEGAGVPTEKTVEKQGEAAQPQQGKREAVHREHLACTDVQKDLFYPGKPGHECARHGHKEEQLHPGAQPCTALFVPLTLLRRC